ncbi:MAG: hypothetical protein GY940_24735, partial [bacterium]|nr:hypothetical protein [bacterium]
MSTNKETVSRRRVWLFRLLIFFVIPLLLVLLVEFGLRLAGYGYPTGATIKYSTNGTPSVVDNYRFSWRFFPHKMAREFDPFRFPARKADNAYRIFILGSSPAQGVPDGAYGFGRILEVMLRETYPGITFEVINTAITAINSHVVRDIATDCARHRPDLFIVYMGNNEIVGPYGPGTVFTPISSSLAAIRTGMAFKATKIGQLLSNIISGFGKKKETGGGWKGLEMFLGNQVAPDDPRLETVYSHYRRNLEELRQIALDAKSNIIFCTVANNLKDSPPFASMHTT